MLETFYDMFKNALNGEENGLMLPSDMDFDYNLEEGWMSISNKDYSLKVFKDE